MTELSPMVMLTEVAADAEVELEVVGEVEPGRTAPRAGSRSLAYSCNPHGESPLLL